MVSLWPFNKDESSPASFERALSSLSSKITNTQARLEETRATSRRIRVLSTLYLSFAYVVYAIVALLVVGWTEMGAYEWIGMAVGPIVIYLVRTISSTVYEVRIESLSSRLREQQAERAKTIQKLKDATKYDTTLELLEKYGDGDGKLRNRKKATDEGQLESSMKNAGGLSRPNLGTQSRTNIPPPPTANIPRHHPLPSSHGTPVPLGTGPYKPPQYRVPSSDQLLDVGADFAPNAFDAPRPPPKMHGNSHEAALAGSQGHWYDKVIDLLMGEDETSPRNRIVLICKNCRLVNGQAPPGTKSLLEMGKWKCMACGTTNGEVDEGNRLTAGVLGQELHNQGTTADDAGESSHLFEAHSSEDRTDNDVPPSREKARGPKGPRRRKTRSQK